MRSKRESTRCKSCRTNRPPTRFEIEKCPQCNRILHSTIGRPRHGWKLRFSLSPNHEEIRITGDRKGLEYLAQCCLSIIGRKDPSGHFLIDSYMYNASEGSVPAVLAFDDDPEGKIPLAATGRPK